jgi:hypothetical protein
MAQKLDNNSWLFLYSQITGGLIGKQVLLDSTNGIITNPTYGNGLFRATNTGNSTPIIAANKATDNFYDVYVEVVQNNLTPEITVKANWYAEKQTGQQTLLGYMSNPNVFVAQVNIIQFGKGYISGPNPLTDTTTKYHTLLFNNNSPSISSTLIIDYFLNNTILPQQQSVTVNQLGNYIFQLRNNIIYDGIRVEFNSSSSLRTNLVGLLQTDEPVTPENLVCFGEGSMVFTPSGEVPIQNLKQGDQVYDENLNIQTVEFIAKRTVFPSKSLNKYSVPIQIKQGQLGENVPRLDTIVSSAHLIKHKGQMVPASSLGSELEINTPITYYNVKVSNYSTMIVNGIVSETLDTSNDSKVYSKVY